MFRFDRFEDVEREASGILLLDSYVFTSSDWPCVEYLNVTLVVIDRSHHVRDVSSALTVEHGTCLYGDICKTPWYWTSPNLEPRLSPSKYSVG